MAVGTPPVLYEIPLASPDLRFALRLQAVATSGLIGDKHRSDSKAVTNFFGLEVVQEVPREPVYLEYVLASVLMEEKADAAKKRVNDMREVAPDKAFANVPEQAKVLVQQVAYTIEIPFEGSALALQTWANILTGARVKDPTFMTTGALLGLAIATGLVSPAAIFWVPAGIIACAAARDFAIWMRTKCLRLPIDSPAPIADLVKKTRQYRPPQLPGMLGDVVS